MKTLLIGACVLALTGAAYAHPGHGAGGGPPAGATFGPPAAATAHIPNGVANGQAGDNGVAEAANLLGNLNAAHASSTALAHASPKSIVGALAAYKTSVSTATANLNAAEAQLATDQAKLATDTANNAPAATITADNQAIANDQAAIAAAQAAITAAQNTLALRANKPLTPDVIAKVNSLLGL